jgi:hypothetical protein
MKIVPVVNHLQKYLLKQTNLVSTELISSSASVDGTVLTLTFSKAHELETGEYVRIADSMSAIPITSLSRSGSLVTATTTQDHDLTKGFCQNVKVSGANESAYNISFEPVDVLSATVFQYTVQGEPLSPGTGDIVLETQFNSYNGWYSVTKVNTTTISIDLGFVPYASLNNQIKIRKEPRISTIFTDPQVDAFLQNKFPAFYKRDKNTYILVRPSDIATSKNKDLIFDGQGFAGQGQSLRYITMEQLEVYILISLNDSYITEPTAYDMAQELRTYIYKSLLAYRAPTNFGEVAAVSGFVPTFARYQSNDQFKNIFIYGLGFEQRVDITNADTFQSQFESRAFRSFKADLLTQNPDTTAEGDL